MNEVRENPKLPQPYIQEYYNVKPYFQTSRDRVPARILNSLVDAINERQRLLRFLLVILDKDLLHDMNVSCGENLSQIFNLRPKFNDALNDATVRANQRILTINSCNTGSHFDHKGNLSDKGKDAFWMEIDDLLHRFDGNQVKLLPNPKFKAAKHQQHNNHANYY